MKEDLVLSPKPEICMANKTMEQQCKVTFFHLSLSRNEKLLILCTGNINSNFVGNGTIA